MAEYIFNNPITGNSKNIFDCTMLDDFPPEVCARIMAETKWRYSSYAKRAIIASFLLRNPIALFIELPTAISTYMVFKCGLDTTEEEVLQSIEEKVKQCITAVHLNPPILFERYFSEVPKLITELLCNEFWGECFDWMEEADDELLWLKFYERLNQPSLFPVAPEYDSTDLIGNMKKHFDGNTSHKELDWKSYVSGWLEGRVELILDATKFRKDKLLLPVKGDT